MRVFITRTCRKEIGKHLSADQRRQLGTFIARVKDGSQRGKRLHGRWLYEAKIEEKRAYYVKDSQACLFVSVSSKKRQQDKIDELLQDKKEYLRELRRLTAR